MLVAHGSIEATLRHFIAGRLEVNRAQSLICFLLGEHQLRK
jgi:hypothetical protein